MSALKVVVSALAAKSYGGDSYFRSFIPAMLKHAPEVELVVLASDDTYLKLFPEAAQYRWEFFPGVGSMGAARIVWEQLRLPAFLGRLRADVFYSPMNTTVLGGNVPSVIAVRNMDPLTPAPADVPVKHRLRNSLLKRMTLASAGRARSVVAVSEHVKRTLVGLGIPEGKITVIYHGIDDIAAPSEGGTSSGAFMGAAAKFIRYSNLDSVVRAFAHVRQAGYPGRLRIAGGHYDAGYEAEVRGLIRSLGLDEHVELLGYVPRSQVLDLMRRCDSFFFASSIEACPFSLLEAMRMGAPIVCSTAAPMPEFGAEAVLYADGRDASAMAREALRFVNDKALAERMRGAARKRAEGFTWGEHVRRLLMVLRGR